MTYLEWARSSYAPEQYNVDYDYGSLYVNGTYFCEVITGSGWEFTFSDNSYVGLFSIIEDGVEITADISSEGFSDEDTEEE